MKKFFHIFSSVTLVIACAFFIGSIDAGKNAGKNVGKDKPIVVYTDNPQG
ncbi:MULTISPECIES: hypothetical protein [Brevibacillus]|jgi:hypothetical protein|nr:hypothetical protein [Brevibacillus borstelensis]MED1884983.1 hypothetical protein [Brevibacillus borstelensis]GED54506.1 hypothetical protein BBO01nite_37470 [Brevibacillus borstelensis]